MKSKSISKSYYSISNNGLIFNHNKNCYCKPFKSSSGSLYVSLRINGTWKSLSVAKLVYKHFNNHVVLKNHRILHIDFDRLNNYFKNLKRVSHGDLLRAWYSYKNVKRGVYKYNYKSVNSLTKKWRAVLKVNDKVKTVGYFKTQKEAYIGFSQAFEERYGYKPFVMDVR